MNNQHILKTLVLVILAVSFAACNTRKAQEKEADNRLKHILQLINDNSLNAAKIEIDSIHLLFPRLVEKRKIAAAYEDTIVRRESARSLAYCDSILPFKIHEADSIGKNFRFEKDTAYQELGNYVYKTQRTESNATRTYLKAYIDENADFYLVSNYYGSKIDHTYIVVSVNDLFERTDSIPTDDPYSHSFNDEGSHWEAITFKNDAEKNVASFIAQNVSERIKVTLHGKKNYVYYLSDADKQAIRETYNFWIVKKDVVQLQKEIKKATIKIEKIKREYGSK